MDMLNALQVGEKEGVSSGLLGVLKGIRNGFVYGARIRAPHAFVMAVLFREGTLWSKMVSTLTATWAHGKTLGKFAGVYKLILMALDLVKGHNAAAHSFIAGGVGGYLVWGDETSVNKQGPLGRRLPNPLGEGSKKTHAVFAAFVWAMVMFLFEYDSKNLNGSLVASMRYIYHDSNRWKTISDFLPTYKAFATLDR